MKRAIAVLILMSGCDDSRATHAQTGLYQVHCMPVGDAGVTCCMSAEGLSCMRPNVVVQQQGWSGAEVECQWQDGSFHDPNAIHLSAGVVFVNVK